MMAGLGGQSSVRRDTQTVGAQGDDSEEPTAHFTGD